SSGGGPTDNGATVPPNPTGGGNPTVGWTAMVDLAGDNELGQPAAAARANLTMPGHFDSLRQLAAGRTNLRITVLQDFTGPKHTQFRDLRPTAGPKCGAPAGKNSADPATLTAFIDRSLSLGPTTHKMLIIEGHGHAINGIALDNTVPGLPDQFDQMQPNQIR